MLPTAYIETSVISYLTALPSRDVVIAAYQQVTREWWRTARNRFELVASELVLQEAAAGDSAAARARLAALETVTLLEATDDAATLTRKFLDLGAIPRKAAEDAAHIANAVLRSRIEHVCRQAGYEPPVICTPNELIAPDHADATS